jgi:hypothetical protein
MVIRENWMDWREVLVVSVECLVALTFLILPYVYYHTE